MGNLEGYPSVSWQMMFRYVPAAMKVERQSCGAFLEGLAEQVGPPNDYRQGLRNSLTASALAVALDRPYLLHLHRSPKRSSAREDSTVFRPGRERITALKLFLGNGRSAEHPIPNKRSYFFFFFVVLLRSSVPTCVSAPPLS